MYIYFIKDIDRVHITVLMLVFLVEFSDVH